MKKRPLAIILIALFHILVAPSLVMLYNFYSLGINPISQIQLLVENKHYAYLWSLLSSPLVGIIILLYRRWSLLVFWIIKLLVLAGNYKHMMKLYELEMYSQIAIALSITILNIVVVTYFLVPVVFRSFSDYSLHWWKQKKRFLFKVPVQISQNEQSFEGQIVNISESGVFISSAKELYLDSVADIAFSYEELNFKLKIKLAYLGPDKKSCGAQFVELTRDHSKKLLKLTLLLRKKGLISEREEMSRFHELSLWLKRLLKGDLKALFPKY
jgi:hypothetical protein